MVVISILLLALCPKATADFVFTSFDNQTGWPDGMAWLLGLLQPALSLIGFDVVMHMAEEMPNPRRDVPKAMLLAIASGNTFLDLGEQSTLGTVTTVSAELATVAKQAFYDFGERPMWAERTTYGTGMFYGSFGFDATYPACRRCCDFGHCDFQWPS